MSNTKTYFVDGGGVRHQVKGTCFLIEDGHLIVRSSTGDAAAFAAGTWLSIKEN